jgi:HSP20 family molecular chaperone IbpA
MEKATATQVVRAPSVRFGDLDSLPAKIQELNEAIARRAFEIFANRGLIHGHDAEDWSQAEAELFHPFHMELQETDEALQIRAEIPGFSEKDLELTVEPQCLTLTGQRETISESFSGKVLYRDSCASQIFRRIELPVPIQTNAVVATLRNGILDIWMPKAEQAEKTTIETKAA